MKKRVLYMAVLLFMCLSVFIGNSPISAFAAVDTLGQNTLMGAIGQYNSCLFIINSDRELWLYRDPSYQSNYDEAKKTHLMDDVAKVIYISDVAIVLKTDGTLWALCPKDRNAETWEFYDAVKLMDNVKTVQRDNIYRFCILTQDGTLYCANNETKYGNTPTKSDFPMRTVANDVTDVTASGYYLSKKQEVWHYDYGKDAKEIKKALETTNATSIHRSSDGTFFVLTQDGDLWGWGYNRNGQVGNNGRYDYARAIYVGNYSEGVQSVNLMCEFPDKIMTNVSEIWCDAKNAIYAKDTEGTIWTWGDGTPAQALITTDNNGQANMSNITLPADKTGYSPRVQESSQDLLFAYENVRVFKDGAVYIAGTSGDWRYFTSWHATTYSSTQNPSAWAADAANWIKGYPEIYGWFDGYWQHEICREEFAAVTVTMVEEALGKSLSSAPTTTFTDTSDSYVLKAYQAGIVAGTSATTFAPESSLTREQLATMLYRAIQYIEQETGKTVLTQTGALDKFTDREQVSSWATDAVASLAANDIMKGTGETTLSPKSTATIEQALVLALRVLDGLK